jgi:hypothetical protein
LTDLYHISKGKHLVETKLGHQTLHPQKINTGDSVYLPPALLDDKPTSYLIRRKDRGTTTDCTNDPNGTLTFHSSGVYTIYMHNDAIVYQVEDEDIYYEVEEYYYYPEVKATFIVVNPEIL